MNHDCARQVESGPHAGKWHYTTANKRTGAHPIGYCSMIKPCPDCNSDGRRFGKSLGEDTGCATCAGEASLTKPEAERCYHDTRAEAETHYKEYLLGRLRFQDDSADPRQLNRCQASDCKTMTDGSAQAGGERHWTLCATHRNRETVSALLTVGESWHS